jgi:hypothetical protein
LSLAKSCLLISIGLLVGFHLETVLSLIIRKPIPENLISAERLNSVSEVIKWIGIFIIITGVVIAISSLVTLVVSLGMTYK